MQMCPLQLRMFLLNLYSKSRWVSWVNSVGMVLVNRRDQRSSLILLANLVGLRMAEDICHTCPYTAE